MSNTSSQISGVQPNPSSNTHSASKSTSVVSENPSSMTRAQLYLQKTVEPDEDNLGTTLLAMGLCLSDEECQIDRVTKFYNDRVITKTSVTPDKDHIRREIDRRLRIIHQKEELEGTKKTKQPRYSNWDRPKLVGWIQKHKLTGLEREWVANRIVQFCDDIDQQIMMDMKKKKETGGGIPRVSKLKMRFYMACFLDEFRDAMMEMYNSQSRQELDARNSGSRPPTFFELVTAKYNDENWIPDSIVFNEFHHELSVSFPLPLYRTDGQEEKREPKLTVDKATNIYRDAKAAMNWSLSAWKKSGNGKGNLNDDDITRIRGTVYTDDSGGLLDDNNGVVYVDDDRFDFCSNSIPYGYFWCLAEMHDIVNNISQNCSEIGLSMVPKTTAGYGDLFLKSNEKKKANKHYDLINNMELLIKRSRREMKLNFRNKTQNQLQTLHNDLWSTGSYQADAENDYLNSYQRMMEYRIRSDKDPEFLELLQNINSNKKRRLDDLELEGERIRKKIAQVESIEKELKLDTETTIDMCSDDEAIGVSNSS